MGETVDAASALRARLEAALRVAITDRDERAARALRSALGALDNAGAVPDHGVRTGRPEGQTIEGSAVGAGAAEAPRRRLSAGDAAAIVRAEIDERLSAAAQYLRLGQEARAGELAAEAAALEPFVR